MADPVNLANLREMTGGDKEMETELFQVFLSSSSECLKALMSYLCSGQEENWRNQAHALKGMSLNIGADNLGSLCAEAQMNHLAPQDEKARLLVSISAEYKEVETFLKAQTER